MDDALGNALVIEMEDFLAQHEILEQRRAPLAGAERILIVGDPVPEMSVKCAAASECRASSAIC